MKTHSNTITEDQLLNLLSEYLQEVNNNKQERLRRIDIFLEFLMYNKRITELNGKEIIAFVKVMEGSLTKEERKKMDDCKSEKEREELEHSLATLNYIRKCAWTDYLLGKRLIPIVQ